LGLSCINVVNVEDSPITKVINELARQNGEDEGWFESENIGLYMKSGFCYSDVKSFIPEVISLSLVALWFSHEKSTTADKQSLAKREKLMAEIDLLPQHLESMMKPEFLQTYLKIAKMLKNQHNLFILAKGAALPVAQYMS
jgi:glucosamine 6-phosphate synthetase-like amidotransferase/phosphosugar isomerase protein